MPVSINELNVATARAGGNGSDIFLHIKGKRAGKIKGESNSPEHVDDIEVFSWRWGVSASPGVGTTLAAGRRSYTGLTVVKSIDTATTSLMSALATNDEIKEAKLTMRRAGGEQIDYFLITLEGARISSIEHSVNAQGDTVETLTLLFHKVEVEYRQQRGTGLRGGAYVFNDDISPNA